MAALSSERASHALSSQLVRSTTNMIHHVRMTRSSVRHIPLTNAIDEVAPTSYWQVIEACIGILCACLPTLRPILSNIRLPFFKPLLESLRKKASSTQLRSKQSLPTSTIRHVSSARSLFAKRSASESGDGGSPRERASDEPMPSLPMPRHEMV